MEERISIIILVETPQPAFLDWQVDSSRAEDTKRILGNKI
jgi:hypothetical protein